MIQLKFRVLLSFFSTQRDNFGSFLVLRELFSIAFLIFLGILFYEMNSVRDFLYFHNLFLMKDFPDGARMIEISFDIGPNTHFIRSFKRLFISQQCLYLLYFLMTKELILKTYANYSYLDSSS